jgi:hypothetical protein
MPRSLSLFFFAAAALFGQQAGWKEIFPDEKFSGWHRVSIPPGKPVSEPSQWRIDRQARTIVCEGTGGHDMILYDTEFSDLELHVEWRYTKVADENARYNSGVYVRNSADGSIWHQAQAGQDGVFLFGRSIIDGAPKGFNLKKMSTENPVKPVGEWNAFDITAKGRTLSLTVNGKRVSEFTECGVPRGMIGLEAEGFRIEFRNLRVRPLAP